MEECACDLIDLHVADHRGTNRCGETLERDYLVENCGRATLEISVPVEFWAGQSPEDPEAVLLQSAATTPGMPGLSAEWVDFSIPWAQAEPHLNGARDAFVIVDRLNVVHECAEDTDTDARNMLFDAVWCR